MRDSNNQNKYNLLGEPIGTASNKLKKAILFNLARKLGLDICFHCNEKIESVDNFSIEHKIPWQSSRNPIESFYDLDNIAFSHLHCNISSARKNNHSPRQDMLGEKNINAKLTEQNVRDIRNNLSNNIKIADKYNVSSTTISDIKLGKYWKHVK